jgi:hypothetical protein
MKKIILISIVLLVLLMVSSCKKEYHPTLKPEWAEITIRAKGIGAPPAEAANNAQARLLACRAAKMDAYRNMSEQIFGIQISSSTYVRDFVTENDEIRSRVQGFIKKARIINERENQDGSCEVTLELFLGKRFADIIMR